MSTPAHGQGPFGDRSPVRVGPYLLASPVLLAPMSGITDLAFRRCVSVLGAGLVICEMVASEQLVRDCTGVGGRAQGGDIRPLVIQLVGSEARWMAEGARIAAALGADIIDINMGCPAREVTGKLSGSALMRDLDHAVALIEAVVGAVPVPVTLKMRTGWDAGSRNAPQLAARAQAAGVALISVHARTRCQFFKGDADWAFLKAVKEKLRIPLVINGDILDPSTARAALAASGAHAVMVGRGACGAPWMLARIASFLANGRDPGLPPLAAQASIAISHIDAMLSKEGSHQGLRKARKHIGWYLAASPARKEDAKRAWRRRLLTCEDAAQVL